METSFQFVQSPWLPQLDARAKDSQLSLKKTSIQHSLKSLASGYPLPPRDLSEPALEFTVAICTYNGADRLPPVLDGLVHQQGLHDIRWEVILVDNNSTDTTPQLVQRYQEACPGLQLRYTTESRQGAAYARQRAVREARGALVGFLDDDNVPAQDWVAAACEFARHHPHAGVMGSRVQGEFGQDPPLNFERIAAFLALTDRGNWAIPYHPSEKVLPPGAGLVVRRDLWLHHVPAEPFLGGRDGKKMLTGEDLESVLQIQQCGTEIWYNPAMCITHQIPAHRLQRPYLLKLMRGIGLSRHRTRMLSLPNWKRPLMFWAYQINDIRKILVHLMIHGGCAWSDTVAASELTLYVFSLLSPYYLWQLGWQRRFSGEQAQAAAKKPVQ